MRSAQSQREPRRPETEREHREAVRRAVRHVRDHPEQRWSARELARVALVSPAHFERMFQRLTGRELAEHARLVALGRAALALRLTRRRIVEIALEAGYANHESFSRAFRAAFQQSPRDYRRAATNTPGPEGTHTMEPAPLTVAVVKVPVADITRAQGFYRDTLGLPEDFAVPQYGWAQYSAGPVPLCLYVPGMGGGDGQPGGETGIHLEARDLVAFHARVRKCGGETTEIFASDDGGMFCIVSDPDGNRIKVLQGM